MICWIKIIYITIALFLCSFPANLFIQWFLKAFKIGSAEKNEDLQKAGRIIGTLERILFFIFIINDHYDAAGFLIAAKSILRYKETETAKTEYLLIGSLLSFLIALVLGLGYIPLTEMFLRIYSL